MIHKVLRFIGAVGFLMFLFGAGAMDSPSLILPIVMMIIGLLIMAGAAKEAEKWTEE